MEEEVEEQKGLEDEVEEKEVEEEEGSWVWFF